MGEVYALLAAVIWALAVMFLRKSGETVSPFALNLFRVAITVPLLLLTAVALGEPILSGAPLSDYLILFASGVIAIAISDTFFHKSLNMVGAGISAIAGCSYSPFITVMAFLMLGESLGAWQFAGMALIVTGVIVTARHTPPKGATSRQILAGVFWGILAMATVAFGIVIAKPVLLRSSVIWATAMRQVGSLAVLMPLGVLSRRRSQILSVFRRSSSWRFSLPAALLGSYFSLIAWIAGMKYTMTGIAAILNQTSTAFILLFATLFLGEPLTRRKILAGVLALAGIVVITFAP